MASSGSSRRRRRAPTRIVTNSPLFTPSPVTTTMPSPSIIPQSSTVADGVSAKTLAASGSIAQIKSSFLSRLENIKKESESAHASLIKELGAASARLSKRVKLELQSCTQQMDEFERDSNLLTSEHKEDMDELKGDYDEFLTRAQNSASQRNHFT